MNKALLLLVGWLVSGVAACGPPDGKTRYLESTAFKSAALGRRISLSVLAPADEPSKGAMDDVVYLLHGYGGNHASLDDEGLSARLLAAQRSSVVPKIPIVALEGEQGFYINWHDGSARYGDYILDDAIPAAERRLGIDSARVRRHLVGMSMGGYGALVLGLGHPEKFESIASISGVIFDEKKAIDLADNRFLNWTMDIRRILGDGTDRAFLARVNPYSVFKNTAAARRPRLFLAVGNREPDSLRRASAEFHAFLDEQGAAHEWVEFDGGHNWESWGPVIEKAIAHAGRR